MVAKAELRARPARTLMELRNRDGRCPSQTLEKLKELCDRIHRQPTHRELAEEGFNVESLKWMFNTKSVGKVVQLAFDQNPEDAPEIRVGGIRKYSDEALLGMLRNFYFEHHRLPGRSDQKRGLLPSFSCYEYRYGSLRKALDLALEENKVA